MIKIFAYFYVLVSSIYKWLIGIFFPKPERIYPSVTFIRPNDLLVMRFEFRGFEFQQVGESRKTATFLIPGEDAVLIAHFQPQNIAEQAFFEGHDNIKSKAGSDGDLDHGKVGAGSSDTLRSPPVGSRLAGGSRLVFKVPDGERAIPYTPEDLLNRIAEYELKVVPTALPPLPKKPKYVISKYFSNLFLDKSLTNSGKLSIYTSSSLIAGEMSEERLSLTSGPEVSTAPSPGEEALIDVRKRTWLVKSGLSLHMPDPNQEIVEAEIIKAILLYAKPWLRAPKTDETSLELPYRLIISPNKYAAWLHATEAQTSKNGVTELWHTRMAVRVKDAIEENEHFLRTVRAVWTRDTNFKPLHWAQGPAHSNDDPFRTSLDSADRHNLVHLTSNFHIVYTDSKDQARTYDPEAVEVKRLMLTSMGAWINVHGAWEPPLDPKQGGLSVEEWRHRGTLGRDHYVRVVYKGYLLPFGHRASLIKVTERRFHPNKPGNIAYLRQRMFIVVRQPERVYLPKGSVSNTIKAYLRQIPFTRVRITTQVTPDLNDPQQSDIHNRKQNLFWPRVGGDEFYFHLVAEDLDMRRIEFAAPLLFASTDQGIVTSQFYMDKAEENMRTGPKIRRRYQLHGQMLTYAPTQTSGDTAFETDSLTFGITVPGGDDFNELNDAFSEGGNYHPRAFPVLRNAEVRIPAVRHLAANNQATTIQYTSNYVQHAFDADHNLGQVFAEMPGAGLGMDFGGVGDRVGALVQPNLQIKGLSRLIGPVASHAGDLSTVAGGGFNPEDFFRGLNAKIFGVIDLWDIIKLLDPGETIANSLDKVPRFITETLEAAAAFIKDLERFKKSLDLISAHLGTLAGDLTDDYLNLTTIIPKLVDGTATKAELENHLTDFRGHLNALQGVIPGLPDGVPDDVKGDLEALTTMFLDDFSALTFVDQFMDALSIPDELRVRYEWKPVLQNWPNPGGGGNVFEASNNGKSAALVMRAEFQAASKYKPDVRFNVLCSMSNFTIDLIGNSISFIRIHFKKIDFIASSSKKPDVNVEMGEIEFVGVLSFVEVLKDLIPLDGFSDPPAIEVDASGIRAGFSMALPNIAFGVFSLQNLSLGAAFSVPFIGKPLSLRFNFCERHSPFLLTVSMFGGGGFFAITVDPHDVQILEASFEFGASISINFGVASGGVHAMAGIYYAMEMGDASLSGYFRLGGSVSVLGLITASIELYLELHYEFASGKCVGKASLTIEVSVFLFSASVTITCERKFAGSNGDPTFEELMAPYNHPLTGELMTPWAEYCDAFA